MNNLEIEAVLFLRENMFERVDIAFDDFKRRFGGLVDQGSIGKEEENRKKFVDDYDLRNKLMFHNQLRKRLGGEEKVSMLDPLPKVPLLLINIPLTIGYHTQVPVMYVDTIEGYTAVFLPSCEEFFAIDGKILNHKEFYSDCDYGWIN